MLLAATPSSAVQWTEVDEQKGGYLFEFFADVDDIHVFSNHAAYTMLHGSGARMDLRYNHELVVVPAVEAPVGSQESIDAITTASRPIESTADAYTEFTKNRDEIRTGMTYNGLSAGYYVSFETDYFAQQVSGGYMREFFGQNLNLSAGLSYGWDAIEPLQDEDTSQIPDERSTLHMGLVATQVLTPSTVLRVGVEQFLVDGLQHNPYRNVYVDTGNVPELHPDSRSRKDLFVKVNQYLPNRSALHLDYKWYTDDWGIDSHTIGTRLHQYVTENIIVRYRYRYYVQSAAYFYRDEYLQPGGVDGYQTGDYRMGDFDAHLFGSRIEWAMGGVFADSAFLSRLILSLSYERYFNSNNFSANIFESGISFAF